MSYGTTNQYPVYRIPESPSPLSKDSKIVVVMEEEVLDEAHYALLRKILAAIKKEVSSDDIILSSDRHPFRLSETTNTSDDKLILIFGSNPQHLGLQIDQDFYKCIQIGNWKIVNCHSLSDLQTDVAAKKALWDLMKKHLLD